MNAEGVGIMQTIQSIEQFEQEIAKDTPTVIKFFTTWCPDCKNLDRFIDPVIEEHSDKTWLAIDAEQFQPIAEKYQVRGIPSLLVYQSGEKVGHLHSKFAKTPDQVREFFGELATDGDK
jgi:thiol-disulfide isomerase/thioredoxin